MHLSPSINHIIRSPLISFISKTSWPPLKLLDMSHFRLPFLIVRRHFCSLVPFVISGGSNKNMINFLNKEREMGCGEAIWCFATDGPLFKCLDFSVCVVFAAGDPYYRYEEAEEHEYREAGQLLVL